MERMFEWPKDGPGRAIQIQIPNQITESCVLYFSIANFTKRMEGRPESKQLRKRNMQGLSHSKLTSKNKANF